MVSTLMWEAKQLADGELLCTIYGLESKWQAGEERLGANQLASEGSA